MDASWHDLPSPGLGCFRAPICEITVADFNVAVVVVVVFVISITRVLSCDAHQVGEYGGMLGMPPYFLSFEVRTLSKA